MVDLKHCMPFEEFMRSSIDERRSFYMRISGCYDILEGKLFAIGGSRLIYHIEMLLPQAMAEKGKESKLKIKLLKGPHSECHQTSSLFKEAHPDSKLMTGFCLADDGLWRQHSWVEKDGYILEPTPLRRKKYFGIRLA